MTEDERKAARRAYKAALARKRYRAKRGLPEDAKLEMVRNGYSDADIAYIKLNWHSKTIREIAEHLGRSEKAVANKALRDLELGHKTPCRAQTVPANRRMHPLPSELKPTPSEEVRMILEARRKMKERPGAIRLGYRVVSASCR